MARSIRYLESSATPEEDSYGYRIEWDDISVVDFDMTERKAKIKHFGPGSRSVSGFDNAWDVFNDYRDNPDYRGVRLIRIDSDGNERIYAT
ncbi:MAG: hypothetical protein LUG45_01375 [Clostridiales bacterium]|nr:hypothetical protein [Clostridiales bacterium]